MGQNELGEMASALPQLIESFRAIQLRKYMRDNNILPELFDLLSRDAKGKPLLNVATEQASFVEQLTPSIVEYLKRVTANRKKHDEAVKKMGLSDSGGGGWDSGGDSGFGDDANSMDNNMDGDMGMDMDTSETEETPNEETPDDEAQTSNDNLE